MSSLQFPFQLDKRGRLSTDLSRGAMDKSRVLFILGTGIGERVMRPGYGTTITDAVGMVSPGVHSTWEEPYLVVKNVIRVALANAFEQYLPKLVLKDILFDVGFGGSTYLVDVYWGYKNPSVNSNRVENGLLDMRSITNRIGAL